MERFRISRLTLGLTAALAALPSCGPSTTAVRITVTYGAIEVSQIEFTLFSADHTTPLVGPRVLPASAGGPLPSPQSVVVLLPDRAATVICRARLLTAPDQQRETSADVRPHEITDVTLAFAPVTDDGASDADASADGTTSDRPADLAADTGTDTAPDLAPDTGVPDAPVGDAPDDGTSAGKATGDSCLLGAECASTFCARGRCCDKACTGKCMACDLAGSVGNCLPIPAGAAAPTGDCTASPASTCSDDGTCDGDGGCRKHPAGIQCMGASCTGNGASVISAWTCDGKGTCAQGSTINCNPFLCDPTAMKCYTSCASAAQCVPGGTCSGSGSCGLKPLGASCRASSECNGGATCADGVCCSAPCTGSCVLCNLPGKEGLCTAVPAGVVDPRGICVDNGAASCGTNSFCDGMGGCQRYPLGTVCVPQSCGATSGTVVPAKVCDGAGTCAGPAATSCANRFACNPDAGTCYVAPCTADNQCTQSCNTNNGRCK